MSFVPLSKSKATAESKTCSPEFRLKCLVDAVASSWFNIGHWQPLFPGDVTYSIQSRHQRKVTHWDFFLVVFRRPDNQSKTFELFNAKMHSYLLLGMEINNWFQWRTVSNCLDPSAWFEFMLKDSLIQALLLCALQNNNVRCLREASVRLG